jgi:hypothetical protein
VSDLDGRCFIKRGNALIPADFAAEEFLNEIPAGREVIITVRRPRSPQHHRWFFGMLRKVVENTDHWSDESDLLDDLKDAVGHVHKTVNRITGQLRRPTKSIAFANMGEDKFKRFKERCLFVLTQALGWDPVALMDEADEEQRPNPNAPRVAAPSVSPDEEVDDFDEERADEAALALVGRGSEP